MFDDHDRNLSEASEESRQADTALKTDLDVLKADIAALKSDLLDIASARKSVAEDAFRENLATVRKSAESLLFKADKKSRATASEVKETVEKNPLGAVSAAVVVGFLLGRTLFKR